jgi:2-oxoglutarate dehydrogenase complex dehydrogenase (E1) component-like enzyme
LDRKFHITDIAGFFLFFHTQDISEVKNDFGVATLREVLEHLKKSYTRHVGFEYYHIGDPKMREWLRRKIESQDFETTDVASTKRIYKYLMKGEIFEQFLNTKFGSTKRFGFFLFLVLNFF